jgi:hypothetical protein
MCIVFSRSLAWDELERGRSRFRTDDPADDAVGGRDLQVAVSERSLLHAPPLDTVERYFASRR